MKPCLSLSVCGILTPCIFLYIELNPFFRPSKRVCPSLSTFMWIDLLYLSTITANAYRYLSFVPQIPSDCLESADKRGLLSSEFDLLTLLQSSAHVFLRSSSRQIRGLFTLARHAWLIRRHVCSRAALISSMCTTHFYNGPVHTQSGRTGHAVPAIQVMRG
jgi:hypothetical protein